MKIQSVKKLPVCLVAGVLLFAAVSPSAISYAATQKTSQATSTQSQPISQKFIDKYNGAVQLKGGKFVIVKSLLPKGASHSDMVLLNQLVAQNNLKLTQALATAPQSNAVQSGNSVVIADNPQTAKQVAENLPALGRSKYHEGSNYIHHYWWGYRVGLSKTTLHRAAYGLNVAAIFPYDKWIPLGWVVSVVAGILGIAAGNAPGGIVFNYSGLPGTPYGSIWSIGWQ